MLSVRKFLKFNTQRALLWCPCCRRHLHGPPQTPSLQWNSASYLPQKSKKSDIWKRSSIDSSEQSFSSGKQEKIQTAPRYVQIANRYVL